MNWMETGVCPAKVCGVGPEDEPAAWHQSSGMIAFTKSSVWCSRRWQASAVVPSSQSTKVMPVALCRFHGPKLLLLMADDHDRPEVE